MSPFKNVLDGAIGMINFIKYKNVCWNGRYFRGTQGLSQEKALKQLSELQVTGLFFPPWNIHFYLMTDGLWLFTLEYFADIFSKTIARACRLEGNNGQSWFTNDKIELFS